MTVSSYYSNSIKHRFFVNQALVVEQSINADKELGHYIVNVLRLRSGSHIVLFNNSNNEFVCQLEIDKKKVKIGILECFDTTQNESSLPFFLAISMIRSDRFDWAIQKATELGIHGIYPMTTKYTQVKMNTEQLEKRLSHWHKISVSACEQSGRVKLPKIFSPMPLSQLLIDQKDSQIFALCTQNNHTERAIEPITSLSQHKDINKEGRIIGLIGPEGGWQNEELELFEQRQLLQVSLGPRILRSETAAITITALMQSLFGDI